MGTAASDLNTLAGARGARWAPPCEHKDEKSNSRSSQRCGVWRSSHVPQGGEAPLPLPRRPGGHCGRGWRGHCRTPGHLHGAHRCLRGARRLSRRPPGGGCSCAHPRRCLPRRLRGSSEGAQAPTSRGELVPYHFLPPLPPPPTSLLKSPREKVPTTHAVGTPRLAAPGAPAAGSSSPSCAPPAPVPAAALRARGLGAWAGWTARRSRSPAAKEERRVRPRRHAPSKRREKRQGFHSPAGRGGAE
jgi:hypothetical protein